MEGLAACFEIPWRRGERPALWQSEVANYEEIVQF